MSEFWSRVRKGRLFQVLALYAGASWVILQVADALEDTLNLPDWVGAAAFLLLLTGLVVIVGTAWIQSHPLVDERARAEEVPHAWELDLPDLKRTVTRGRLPHLTWARTLAGGGIVFLLLFGFAGLYVVIQDRGRSFSPEPLEAAALPGLAIMPFEVRGEGLEVWREGMVDLLSTNLDGVAGLRGIDSRTALARWRERVRDGSGDLPTVLDAARATGARLALVGSAVRLGPRVRLTADLYDLRTGRSLGSPRAEGPMDSVLTLVDRLSVDVVRVALDDPDLSAAGGVPVRDPTTLSTSSLAAVQAYLEGEASFRAGDFDAAIDAYERALAEDSVFALAMVRLEAAYGWAEGLGSESRRSYGDRALDRLDALPPREAALARASHDAVAGDPEAIEALERLTRRYPDDPEIWYELGDSYYHVGARLLVPRTETRRTFDRAIALDSSFAPAYIHPFEIAIGRYDTLAARRYLEAYKRHAPPGSAFREAMDVTYRLVARPDSADAIAAGLPTEEMGRVRSRLLSGGLAGAAPMARVAGEAQRRPTLPAGLNPQLLRVDRVRSLMVLGRLRGAVEEARELPPRPKVFLLYTPTWFGVTADTAAVDSAVTASGVAPIRALNAADRGRWAEYDTFMEEVRDSLVALAARDSADAAVEGGFVDAARAYATWHRAGPAAALEPMTAAYRRVVDAGNDAWPIRVWLGHILSELGREAESLRYFASMEHDTPWALFRAAQAHEALGNTAEAVEAYAILHRLWRDADPDLPHARAVEQALARLSAEG